MKTIDKYKSTVDFINDFKNQVNSETGIIGRIEALENQNSSRGYNPVSKIKWIDLIYKKIYINLLNYLNNINGILRQSKLIILSNVLKSLIFLSDYNQYNLYIYVITINKILNILLLYNNKYTIFINRNETYVCILCM